MIFDSMFDFIVFLLLPILLKILHIFVYVNLKNALTTYMLPVICVVPVRIYIIIQLLSSG